LATSLVTNLVELLVVRFVTGIGMGGALPNAVTLVSEYSATRHRRMMVSIMYLGFTVGGVIGGLAAVQLIEEYSWQSIFYVGGILPLALTVLLLPFLPESLHYLVKKADNNAALISKVLKRINPVGNYSAEDRFTIIDEKVDTHIRNLFAEGRMRNTLLLWLAFFINLLVLFGLVYWTPVLPVDMGLSYKKAVAAVFLFNIGGIIGALVLAWMSNRFNPYHTLGTYFCAGALSAIAAGLSAASYPAMIFFVLCLGFTAAAAQVGLYPLATQIYPAAIRVTGIGWAQAWGRVGSIIGPLLGGVLVAFGFGFKAGYVLFGLPLFMAAIAIFLMSDRETNGREYKQNIDQMR
jgi:AAHS family 4-hydroxybenzoate transporter-like MFS transporter